MTSRNLIAAAAFAALASACSQGPIFYAEIEEPSLCKTIPYDQLPPFSGVTPGSDLVWEMPIPLAQQMALFGGNSDGGFAIPADASINIRLIEFTLTAKQGITDFNAVTTSTISVEPFPGSTLTEQALLTYTQDAAHLPGDRLTVAGDKGVDLAAYLNDSTGQSYDGGTMDGNLLIRAVMTGTLPDAEWRADVRACLYMKARVNYLSAYGL